MRINWPKLLQAFGLGDADSSTYSVQLEPGVVANTTKAIIVGFIALASEAFALRDQPWVMVGGMAVTLIVAIVYLIGTWRFAERNPDLALMGGAQLLQLRQLQMSAKDKSLVIDAVPTIGGASNSALIPPAESSEDGGSSA